MTALAVLLVASPVFAQKGRIRDAIVQTDGTKVRAVEVTEMTTAFVSYNKGSQKDQVAADKVAAVHWDSPPDLFAQAQGEEKKGDFENAANHYLEAAKNTDRKPLKEEAMFLGARAQLKASTGDTAKAEAAAGALQAYIDAAPQGFRVPEARLLLGRALRLQGKGAEAETVLKSLEDTAMTEGWGLMWDARAKFERALALVAQNKGPAARSAYQSVVSAVDTAPPGSSKAELMTLKTESLVGEGETYIADKNYAQALNYFRKYTSRSGPGENMLQAAALAGEGQALYLSAIGSDDSKPLRQAQTALAKAQVLDSGNGNTTAKALFFSGKVIQALGPDREKDAKARARAYFDTVIRFYAATPWAAQARSEVSK